MRRLAIFLITILLISSFNLNVFAEDEAYEVNPFYAIESGEEYGQVKEVLNGNKNSMYFQWGRLALNENGEVVFTNRYKSPISSEDNLSEYGLPTNSPRGYENKIDYNITYPDGKALLSVFFNSKLYTDNDGKKLNRAVDFLNMEPEDWKSNIIDPMMDMVNGFYNGEYNEDYEFKGLVLDFEGFTQSYKGLDYSEEELSNLVNKYNQFLGQVRESLDEDKELVILLNPTNVTSHFDGYDFSYINDISDYVILMAYNYQDRVSFSKVKDIGENTNDFHNKPMLYDTQPQYKVKEAVEDLIYIHGVNPKKLLLGLDISGKKWIKIEKETEEETFTYYAFGEPYLSAVEALPIEGEYNEKSMVYTKKILRDNDLFNTNNALQRNIEKYEANGAVIKEVQYFYETPETLYNKYYSIVKDYGLKGIGIWRLGVGSEKTYTSLVDMFNEDIGNHVKYHDKATILKKLGLFNGSNRGFELDREGKRVEAAVMLVRLLGEEKVAEEKNYTHPFLDVPNWADPYIGYLYENGLTKGKSATEFGSDDKVTSSQYITFVLRALGYDDSLGDFKWSESIDKAREINLIDEKIKLRLEYRDKFFRDEVALISYFALNTNLKDQQDLLIDKLIEKGSVDKSTAYFNGVLELESIEDKLSMITEIENGLAFNTSDIEGELDILINKDELPEKAKDFKKISVVNSTDLEKSNEEIIKHYLTNEGEILGETYDELNGYKTTDVNFDESKYLVLLYNEVDKIIGYHFIEDSNINN